jgi:hypothetical protein
MHPTAFEAILFPDPCDNISHEFNRRTDVFTGNKAEMGSSCFLDFRGKWKNQLFRIETI